MRMESYLKIVNGNKFERTTQWKSTNGSLDYRISTQERNEFDLLLLTFVELSFWNTTKLYALSYNKQSFKD